MCIVKGSDFYEFEIAEKAFSTIFSRKSDITGDKIKTEKGFPEIIHWKCRFWHLNVWMYNVVHCQYHRRKSLKFVFAFLFQGRVIWKRGKKGNEVETTFNSKTTSVMSYETWMYTILATMSLWPCSDWLSSSILYHDVIFRSNDVINNPRSIY